MDIASEIEKLMKGGYKRDAARYKDVFDMYFHKRVMPLDCRTRSSHGLILIRVRSFLAL